MPYFADWLAEKVYFIEIPTETEQDAYKVFVTMNDRGLSLTSAEMLKGYLFSEVSDDKLREKLNGTWKEKVFALKELGNGEEEDCIKAWLRAKYADSIRENKKGAEPEDFDLIGGVRASHTRIGLNGSDDYVRFINEFFYFADLYSRIKGYEGILSPDQPFLYYNAALSFTLQSQLCFAPVRAGESSEIARRKLKLVSRFIDLYIYTRVVNYKSLDYSTIKYAMFQLTKRIRGLDLGDLTIQLGKELDDLGISIDGGWQDFRLNQYTKKYIKHMLARVTDYVERGCGLPGHYLDYVAQRSKRPFEVEHIITDHYEWYQDEYASREEFASFRNSPGNLLLLDKSTNASLNDSRYADKMDTYGSQKGNVLSAALTPGHYNHNPQFKWFIDKSGFDFKPYETFGRDQISERTDLLGTIVKRLWTPDFESLD